MKGWFSMDAVKHPECLHDMGFPVCSQGLAHMHTLGPVDCLGLYVPK